MIDALISSKTRIKLLLKFFLNSKTAAYLRGLENEFGESTNGIRVELNRFENAGMLSSSMEGNKKIYRANTEHPLFDEIHNILLKYIGIDKILENVIEKLGQVEQVYLTGTFAKGIDGPVIDILIVGDIDRTFLVGLIERAEEKIGRRIRCIDYAEKEFEDLDPTAFEYEPLLLWRKKEQ
ncbi:MAG: ArsR family transcriptional regulator [Bacteroidetes bacterium]|jgi:predicted nucleotidyltransferase|nr:ArsR family transcriptional regulator [Bacteroidota bacterium]